MSSATMQQPPGAARNAMEIWRRMNERGRYVCYGIDPKKLDSLPVAAMVYEADDITPDVEESLFRFGLETAVAVAPYVGYYKPNIWFWGKFGEAGRRALRRLICRLKELFPNMLIVIDAKCSDIGETAKQAAEEIFGYGCDAVTVNPLPGWDCIKEFVTYEDKITVVLVRMSNMSSSAMQDVPVVIDDNLIDEAATAAGLDPEAVGNRDLILGTKPYYLWIAWQLANLWNQKGNCAAVVGATTPKQMADVVEILGDIPLLSPGFGRQGASVEAIIPAAIGDDGVLRIIANSSSGIMYAFKDEKNAGMSWQEAAAAAAKELHYEIAKWRRAALTKRMMLRVGALKHGHFVLKKGEHARDYLDKDEATYRPEELAEIGELTAEILDGFDVDAVVGPAYGAISLGTMVAVALNRRRGLHGGDQIIAIPAVKKEAGGFELRPNAIQKIMGRNVVVAEDIGTTGTSAAETCQCVMDAGGRVSAITMIWNRGGVTSVKVGAELLPLVDEELTKVPADQCQQCQAGEHISTNVGHGQKYLNDNNMVNCKTCGKLHTSGADCPA